MTVFFSHDTAVEYWRHIFDRTSSPGRAARVRFSGSAETGKRASVAALPDRLTLQENAQTACTAGHSTSTDEATRHIIALQRIHVLTPKASAGKSSKDVQVHRWTVGIPASAFHRISKGVYVSSPEFAFVQMASVLTLTELIALGFELCGTYHLKASSTQASSDVRASEPKLQPLTSVARLVVAVNESAGARGHALALRALKYVVDGSNSPYETLTSMFLCLPVMLGGYGIAKPQMNLHIDFDESIALAAKRTWASGDLVWHDQRLVVEYFGKDHASADRMESDAARIDALNLAGYNVLTVTRAQILSIPRFEELARAIATQTGKRLGKTARGITDARIAMRAEALAWTSSGGYHQE